MATDEGLERLRHARHNIEVLRNRREFLAGRIQARVAEGNVDLIGHDVAEARAIDWALPILEADWDSFARIRRNVQRSEHRLIRLSGGEIDHKPATYWEPAAP